MPTMTSPTDLLKQIESLHVLVLGDFILDRYLWGDCCRISPEAPVPVVRMRSQSSCLGGAGNVVANLRGLGAQVIPIGMVGQDEAGRCVREHLESLACSTEGLCALADRPTVEKTRIIAQNQHLLRIDSEETQPASEAVQAQLKAQVARELKEADICIISDYGKGVCGTALLRFVLRGAQERNIPVLVDPKGDDFARYSGASCIKPNAEEAAVALGGLSLCDKNIVQAAQQLKARFAIERVLITRAERGMTLLADDEVCHIPAVAREVFDVSGAGDTVIAVLAALVGVGASYAMAARWANVAAGLVVGHIGTVPISAHELSAALATSGNGRPLSATGRITNEALGLPDDSVAALEALVVRA